jgi:predicted permease
MIVAMFALGIGASTTVFSVVNSLLIMPVPGYREGDRVVHVMATYPGENERRSFLSVADYDELNRLYSIFDEVGVYQAGVNGIFSEKGEPEILTGIQVSTNILSVLGSQTVIGRSFAPDESVSGDVKVAVISYKIWMKYFNGSEDALGKTVTLGNDRYVVIGVTPEGFKIPGFNADFLSPLDLSQASKSSHDKQVVARLASTSSINDASARLNSLLSDLPDYSAQTKRHQFLLRSVREFYLGDMRATVVLIFTAVTFVLLFMCVNISNLYIANGVRRQREFAIMSALGISRIAFVRKLLIESALIAVIGGCCGIIFAWFGVKALRLSPVIALSELREIKLDACVLLFALAVSTLSGMLSGIFPAIWFSRINIPFSLYGGLANAQVGFALNPRRVPGILIGLQVATASALLICSFLLAGSLYNLTRIDTGFDGRNLLTSWVSLPSSQYSSDVQREAVSQNIIDSVKQVAGVHSACMTNYPLFSGDMSTGLTLAQSAPNGSFEVQYREISLDYFRTLGMSRFKRIRI